MHKKAREILGKIESGEYKLHIPLIAFIETACVVSRLTNDENSVKLALSFLGQYAKTYPDIILFDTSIEIGTKTKASGFDVLFMSCSKITNSLLITDDKKQFEKARDYGSSTEFLRA